MDFSFLSHCVGATLSLTSMKSYDKWLLPCLCHPQPNQLGWKCDDSFLNSPRLPRIANLRGWGLKAGKRRRTVAELYRLRGWETEDCTLAHSEILFTRTLLHNYLCSAPNVFFLCLGTGLPPLYSPKLRIIKKPLARALSAMIWHKLNPSVAEKS